jgi:hypothetical protein
MAAHRKAVRGCDDLCAGGLRKRGSLVASALGQIQSFCFCRVECKKGRIHRVKYWEIIADNLHDAGWSLGWVSATDSNGQTIWIVDVHRDEGKRFAVRADEKLTAFLELECSTQRI